MWKEISTRVLHHRSRQQVNHTSIDNSVPQTKCEQFVMQILRVIRNAFCLWHSLSASRYFSCSVSLTANKHRRSSSAFSSFACFCPKAHTQTDIAATQTEGSHQPQTQSNDVPHTWDVLTGQSDGQRPPTDPTPPNFNIGLRPTCAWSVELVSPAHTLTPSLPPTLTHSNPGPSERALLLLNRKIYIHPQRWEDFTFLFGSYSEALEGKNIVLRRHPLVPVAGAGRRAACCIICRWSNDRVSLPSFIASFVTVNSRSHNHSKR